mmetsp:Transcript_4244/g.11861  ORF Transcript_4244/g.11861 Transcript_4244/m.11861 type:complete len:267 (-) Transcript_4244:122-922(-)
MSLGTNSASLSPSAPSTVSFSSKASSNSSLSTIASSVGVLANCTLVRKYNRAKSSSCKDELSAFKKYLATTSKGCDLRILNLNVFALPLSDGCRASSVCFDSRSGGTISWSVMVFVSVSGYSSPSSSSTASGKEALGARTALLPDEFCSFIYSYMTSSLSKSSSSELSRSIVNVVSVFLGCFVSGFSWLVGLDSFGFFDFRGETACGRFLFLPLFAFPFPKNDWQSSSLESLFELRALRIANRLALSTRSNDDIVVLLDFRTVLIF